MTSDPIETKHYAVAERDPSRCGAQLTSILKGAG
jgi:hypothetical protein